MRPFPLRAATALLACAMLHATAFAAADAAKACTRQGGEFFQTARGARCIGAADLDACRQAGGDYRPICRSRVPVCIRPAPDAGKPCRDRSDCAFGCIATDAAAREARAEAVNGTGAASATEIISGDIPAPGVCKEDNDACGCHNWVIAGKVISKCVD